MPIFRLKVIRFYPKLRSLPAPPVAQQIPLPDPNKPALTTLSSTPAPSPRSTVVRLKQWLVDMLSKAEKGTWAKVLDIDDKDIPPSPYLKLLVGKGSGLESPQLPSDQGTEVIQVSSKGTQPSSLKIRLRDGHVLEIQQAERLDRNVLDRLAYCVLEIRSRLEDPKLTQNNFRTARVIFTPALPEVPFFPSDWSIGGELDSGANAFFRLTDKLQKDLQARIRVHRITLSFLPGDETGWKIDRTLENPGESPLGKKFVRTLELELPDGRWPVDLNVTTHFDRTVQTTPPIECELVDSLSSGEKNAAQKDVAGPKTIFGGDSIEPRKSRTRAQANRARATKDTKRSERQHDEEEDETDPAPRVRQSGKLDSHAFILELFRHFGRLHGSIVLRVQNGASEEDVEILKFSKAPVLTGQ